MRPFLTIASILLIAVSAHAKTWLAVSPDQALTEALSPLIEHRRAQGFDVTIATSSVEEAIVTLGAPPDYLILIGSDQLIPAKRGSQYRWLTTQNETFAADPLFSDLDGNGIPQFPVGRIPAETPEQIAAVAAKIIAYENRELRIEDLNIPVWSGTPAYGKLLDETADWLLMSTINKHLPDWAQPWIISANPSNTLNGWPRDQARLFNTQIQGGGAVTAMMGHGGTELFLSMQHPEQIVYTKRDTASLVTASPPLVIFACDCGNFAHPRSRSLAATLLLGKGGPVATIAATTESHPLTNFYSSIALMEELSNPEFDRVGDLWLASQLKAQKMRKPLIERLLKNVEGALEVEIDIPKLKRDQLQMYTYLGDPAQAVALPKRLDATITKSEDGKWSWSAKKSSSNERLYVQHRPQSTPLRAKPVDADRDLSLKLFEQRNGLFAYKTLTEIEKSDKWSGHFDQPGDIRLVAISDKGIRVATKKLR
ncbi:MAG: hypothetical protein ACI8XO_002047 [Verrucomicrobiales bacterium]